MLWYVLWIDVYSQDEMKDIYFSEINECSDQMTDYHLVLEDNFKRDVFFSIS